MLIRQLSNKSEIKEKYMSGWNVTPCCNRQFPMLTSNGANPKKTV